MLKDEIKILIPIGMSNTALLFNEEQSATEPRRAFNAQDLDSSEYVPDPASVGNEIMQIGDMLEFDV